MVTSVHIAIDVYATAALFPLYMQHSSCLPVICVGSQKNVVFKTLEIL